VTPRRENIMPELRLNLVFGSHPGRFQPIFDGRVKPDGIALNCSRMSVDELFWRIPAQDDIDVAELSLTGTIWGKQHGKRWTALPIFPGWVFGCHTETLVRRDAGIARPEDLKGKRVGVPEYPVTAIAWIRDAFARKYGVAREDIHWFEERAADYSHYRPLGWRPPAGVTVDIIPKEKRLSEMLIAGELDAVTRYFGRPENATRTHQGDRSTLAIAELAAHPRIHWLYDDRKAAAIAYCQAIGWPQPIHCVIVKTEIVDQDPTVPARLTRAFLEAARLAPNSPGDHSNIHAASYTLTAAEEAAAIGGDFLPAGLDGKNRAAMERMLALCWSDGYIDRGTPFTVEEYFNASTLAL
jgi:4,5-dihydroxyphthalate decarboxylase